MSRRKWSEEETKWLKENYTRLGTAACAQKLNRGLDSVYSKARRLGLAGTEAESEMQKLELEGFQPEGETLEEKTLWWKQEREYELTENECRLIAKLLLDLTALRDERFWNLGVWKVFAKYSRK